MCWVFSCVDAGKYTSSNAAAIAARRVGGLSPLTAAYTEIYGERARERGSEGARERGSEGAAVLASVLRHTSRERPF